MESKNSEGVPEFVTVRLDPRSTCSRSVLQTCAEVGLEMNPNIKYDIVCVNLGKKEQKLAEHTKYHPFGKVPVLLSDQVQLYETDSIMRYVATVIPNRGLIPKDIALKGQMDKLMSIYPAYFFPAFKPMYAELVLKKRYGRGVADMSVVAESKKNTHAVLGVLENEFNSIKGAFFIGDSITLADMRFMPGFMTMKIAKTIDEMLKDYPGLRGWFATMSGMESWKTVLAYKSKFFPQ